MTRIYKFKQIYQINRLNSVSNLNSLPWPNARMAVLAIFTSDYLYCAQWWVGDGRPSYAWPLMGAFHWGPLWEGPFIDFYHSGPCKGPIQEAPCSGAQTGVVAYQSWNVLVACVCSPTAKKYGLKPNSDDESEEFIYQRYLNPHSGPSLTGHSLARTPL